jgi:hypothetical protein
VRRWGESNETEKRSVHWLIREAAPDREKTMKKCTYLPFSFFSFRFIAAFIWAIIVFLGTALLLGVFIGQMFDTLEGAWSIIPAIGELAIPLAAAVWAYRRAIRSHP